MYIRGLLKITTPNCPETDAGGYCDYEGDESHKHQIRDSRDNLTFGPQIIYLPHSCDEWVIGGSEQVSLMIEDLQAVLAKIESK